MFSEIAPRYDLLNRLLSFGADLRWRRRAVDLALEKAPRRILDLATGTWDLALMLKERAPGAEVVGAEAVGGGGGGAVDGAVAVAGGAGAKVEAF